MKKIYNFIGGEFTAPLLESYIENFEPATGKVYSLLPDSEAADVARAVEAAERAFPVWSGLSAEKRADFLLAIVAGILARAEELAQAETIDQGKPIWLSRNTDIPRAAQNFRFFATGIQHYAAESHAMPDAINYTLRNPLGVVGCISPWNLPLYLFTWKIAPALAAGNCVVAKPSELTPMTAFLLAQICHESGLPPGVLNIIHGYGWKAGAEIVAHPRVKAVSFTGGTKTGADIARIAAPMFKKLSLELGGKNPNIIFADCDIDKAVKTAARASFTNQGEICLCGSRILVEHTIYEEFKQKFLKEIQKFRLGDPLHPDTRLGALVSRPHFDKVLSYIELAKQEGGAVIAGGKAVQPAGRCTGGWFVEPTVIEGLGQECRTNQEEIFGPVVTLQPFDAEAEAVRYANSTPYGLAAMIWTQNLGRAHRMAGLLETGIVWVNCWMVRDLRTPFGGVKQSGVGREGGWEALRFFTEPKNVCVDLT